MEEKSCEENFKNQLIPILDKWKSGYTPIGTIFDFIDDYIESSESIDFELKACEYCLQLTNHIGEICQKCKTSSVSNEIKFAEWIGNQGWVYNPKQEKWMHLTSGMMNSVYKTTDDLFEIFTIETKKKYETT